MLSLRCQPSFSSPTSPQLRFGCRCRQPSSVFPLVRFTPSSRRISLVSVAGAAASGGGGEVQSSNGSNTSPDSFAGWSDAGTGGEESKKNGGIGGLLGAGLAGLLFSAGVTFATLSLVNKNASGSKQQMEPLTREQESLINSDDINKKHEQLGNEISVVLPHKETEINNHDSHNDSGTIKDLNPPTEIIGDAGESKYDVMKDMEVSLVKNDKAADSGVDIVSRVSGEDIEIIHDVDNSPLPLGASGSQPLTTAHADELSSDAPKLKDTESATSSNELDSLVGYDVEVGSNAGRVDLASLDSDSTNRISSNHGKNLHPNSETPVHFSSGIEGQPTSDSYTPNVDTLESGDNMDSQLGIKDLVDVSVSNDQYIDKNDLPTEASTNASVMPNIKETALLGKSINLDSDNIDELMVQLSTISSPEEHKFIDNASSMALISADPSQKAPDLEQDCETYKSSSFVSVLPRKTSSHFGIPAPSLVSAALQVPPGKVLVPSVVNHVQGQALAALQVLKVIEVDVQPGDLCTRREYARWLVSASSVLSRTPASKVYPAMYIENVTELAFDDITIEDPDFKYIQGLAEAGIISSKLSLSDSSGSNSQQEGVFFYPDSPVSRQDLVSWKMALERMQLPEVDRNYLYQCTGYIDINKINPDAWPALVADLSAGEQSITALAFGYTRLFQPEKPVTKAQAAIALATGDAAEMVSEELARIEAESLAEAAVNAHTALVAEVEKDLNSSFEKELAKEKEKVEALEKLAEEARVELERLRTQREEENNELIRGRAAVQSEIEVLSRIRHEVEEQLQSLMSDKLEISYESEKINKLRKEAESENQVIAKLQYELEVERKALSLARSWAEEEAKRAREQAKTLEEARERWESRGLKVVVDEDLRHDGSIGTTWLTAGEQPKADETIESGESLVERLKGMAAEMKLRSSAVIEKIIQKIVILISTLKQRVLEASDHAISLQNALSSRVKSSINELQENASTFRIVVRDKTRRAIEDCKEGMGKITQRFKQ